MIENVFATTFTGLPDVPYWRGGDTVDVDCMGIWLYRLE